MATVYKYLTVTFLLSFFTMAHAQHTDCYVADDNASAREHLVDMQHMLLDVNFKPNEGTVQGVVNYQFTALRKTVDSLFLDAPDITISQILLDGQEVKHRTNKDGLIVDFKPPLAWDSQHSLQITYSATPRKGIYFIGWNDTTNTSRKQIWTQGQGIDNRYWIPSFDDMSDKLITELKVTFDSGYKVLGNGELKKEKPNKDGTTTWHYAMTKPHPPYLVMLTIGDYAISTSKSKGGVTINNWYYPQYPDRVEPTYRYTTDMMDWMEKEFGLPYPWHAYSQVPVQDFMYGAMENTTATIFGDFYLIDSRAFLDRYYIGTNAHELAHQWFGDYVTARSPEHVWLQESFATHYQKHFERSIFGEDHFQWNRRNELWRVLSAGKSDDKPIMHSSAGSARIYPKGSLVLDMIKYLIGREQFNKALKYYLEQHPYESVDTDDFLLAFYETLGINLDWFAEQWLYHGGEPHYEVSYTAVPGQTLINVKQIHERKDVVGLFNMPIDIEVHYADGSLDKQRAQIDAESHLIAIPNSSNKAIAYVLFDPNSEIIKHLTFNKDYNELAAQATGAANMIDRYDALVALRKTDTDQKRVLLMDRYKQEGFWALRMEIASQLVNDWENLPDAFFLSMLNDPHARVRETVIKDINLIHARYLDAFEKMLTDSSYNVIEETLVKLSDYFPQNIDKYLALTKDIEGVGNKVRIAWLEIAVNHDALKYMPVLKAHLSHAYEFQTRTRAMRAISKFNYLDQEAVDFLVDAALNPNRRLSGPAVSTLKSYMGQLQYEKMIREYHRSREWADWQQQVWDDIL